MLRWLLSFFRDPWEYGSVIGLDARRHVRSGVVQMKRPAGWIDFHPDHWHKFKSRELVEQK